MKDCKASAKRIAVFIATALCFITISATDASAQGGNARASSAERRTESMSRKREQYERDTLDKGHNGNPTTPEQQRKALAVTAQVKHDFERIQTVYNEIVLAMAANEALDHKFILDATAEVKKCAGRLRGNLALPQPEGNEKENKKAGDLDDEQMFHFQDFKNEILGVTDVPNITFPSVTTGQNINVPQATLEKKYQFRNDFSWQMGSHQIKVGTNYIWTQLDGFFFFGARGYAPPSSTTR